MAQNLIDKYLEQTGQTEQELFAGQQQYGPAHINDLVDQALKQNKKITFVPELTDGLDLGQGKYILEEITEA